MSDIPNLPTPAELKALWSRLADVHDEVETASHRVLAASNFSEEQDVTYDHVGSIAVFARDVQNVGTSLLELGKMVELTARKDLETSRREGKQENVPKFDEVRRAN
jgi:hypothetical protein